MYHILLLGNAINTNWETIVPFCHILLDKLRHAIKKLLVVITQLSTVNTNHLHLQRPVCVGIVTLLDLRLASQTLFLNNNFAQRVIVSK